MEKLSLLLKGGRHWRFPELKGVGAVPVASDVGIRGDAIVYVGTGRPPRAEKVIDVDGLAVCPGFIDTHCHSDFSVLKEPPESKIFQGVTTEINGNCGLSAAPLYGAALRQRKDDLKGIKEKWASLDEYFKVLENRRLYINFATLAGHGNIRASVMGYENRRPTGDEMEAMKRLLREALLSGAIGLSTGLIYPPGVYSDTEELIELAKYGNSICTSLGGFGPESAALPAPNARAAPASGSRRPTGRFIYASHMRSEGDRLIEAIKEIIAIGRKSGAGVHISHIKTSGQKNWPKISRAVSLIERARAGGVRLTCDRYPYTAGATDLDAVLPAWTYEGGKAEELRRLKSPSIGGRIKKEVTATSPNWDGVVVSSVWSKKNTRYEGMSLSEIAGATGKKPVDALFDLLIEERLRVDALFHSMSEDNLKRFLSLPYVMVGSDSSALAFSGKGKPHPRAFGTFPRFLGRYAKDLKSAIHKTTALPAQTFGLRDRGRIEEGFKADIVVFDPQKIKDRATFEEPYAKPEGIHHVIVNGIPVLMDGRLTGKRPGRVLRHGR